MQLCYDHVQLVYAVAVLQAIHAQISGIGFADCVLIGVYTVDVL